MFCAVRSDDSFLAPAYCEGLRCNRRYTSFTEFRGRLSWRFLNWRWLLDRLEEGLRPDHVELWQYEQFRELSETLLTALGFGETLDAPLPAMAVTCPS